MKINNPFESGHIKNYILLYASVVVIMVLFFFASTLFNDVKKVEKKSFIADIPETKKIQATEKTAPQEEKMFKLLDKAY
ncbi:MAG TPA: hypothetical protein EYG74_03410 [Sulfurimonas autotrophica]|nr:hypothetical protein [Sulfurimonas autotrophica]